MKQIWSYIKSLRKDNTGLARLKDKGRLFNAAVDKANILNRQYPSVFTQEEPGESPCPDGLSYPDMTEFTVTASGIQKVLQHLNPRKAVGPDNPTICITSSNPPSVNVFKAIYLKWVQNQGIPE